MKGGTRQDRRHDWNHNDSKLSRWAASEKSNPRAFVERQRRKGNVWAVSDSTRQCTADQQSHLSLTFLPPQAPTQTRFQHSSVSGTFLHSQRSQWLGFSLSMIITSQNSEGGSLKSLEHANYSLPPPAAYPHCPPSRPRQTAVKTAALELSVVEV